MSATEMLVVLIGLVGGYFGVSKLFFPAARGTQIERPRPAGERPWFEVLGVAEDSPAEAIQAAYQRLMDPFQPDKVTTLEGDLKAQAAVAVDEITRAYQAGLKARGVRL